MWRERESTNILGERIQKGVVVLVILHEKVVEGSTSESWKTVVTEQKCWEEREMQNNSCEHKMSEISAQKQKHLFSLAES